MRHAVLGVAVCLAFLAAGCGSATSPPVAAQPRPSPGGIALADPVAAPRFTLHDQAGRLAGLGERQDSFTLVTFLYTRCRDVCPLIAVELDRALWQLTRAGIATQVLAVSVDPRGDTAAAVTQFVRQHRLARRFHYLRGTADELRPVWRAYHVAADPDSSTTAVTHSAFVLLVDRAGRERVYYTSNLRAESVVHDVTKLARA